MKLFHKKKATPQSAALEQNALEQPKAELPEMPESAQTAKGWHLFARKGTSKKQDRAAQNEEKKPLKPTPSDTAGKDGEENQQPSTAEVNPAKPPRQWFWMKKKPRSKGSEASNTKPKKTKEPQPVSAPKRWRVVLLGVFLLLLFALSGAGIGYAAGIQQRLALENQQKMVAAATHFNYGVQAMLQSNYEVARIQFEYVLQIAPDFPSLKEKYTQTMIEIAKNSLPTATPQPTPTPDMRGVEALFAQAQQQVNTKQGAAALVTLDTLRNQDIHYRTLEVDALYYMALRFSGMDKILRQADLEGGIYDLTLASHFAPLDHEAVQVAAWARNYITAISYWGVDWEKVVYYLNQVYSASPGLQDSKGNSVRSRTIEALWRYGDVLMERNNYCEAAKYYQYSLNISQQDAVQAKYASANLKCIGPSLTQTAVPTAPPVVEETPTPEVIPETPTP